jgi:hypothetical protein
LAHCPFQGARELGLKGYFYPMKSVCFLVSLLVLCTSPDGTTSAYPRWAHGVSSVADETVQGYIVTPHGDTVMCQICIPKDFGHFNEASLFTKVNILDSTGKKLKYTPKELQGYGFVYQNKAYEYVSRQIDDEGTTKFLRPMNLGDKINGYFYYDYNTSDLQKGSMGSTNEVYVLEDPVSKDIVAVTKGGSVINSYKAQLRKFFENDKQMLALLNKDVKEFKDIPAFIRDANR